MFPPIQSGSSHYAWRVANGLEDRGHEVLVISFRHANPGESAHFGCAKLPGFMLPKTPLTQRYGLPYSLYPASIPLIRQILARFQPTVVHANGHFLDASIAAAQCSKALHLPLVVTIHTRFVHTDPLLNAVMRNLDRAFLGHVWRKSDAIIALDRQMYRYIENTYHVPLDRIAVIPLAIDLPELLSSPEWDASKYGYTPMRRTVVSLSHLTRLKSARTVLSAFAVVAKEFPDIQLVFVGRVMDPTPIQMTSQLGLKGRVRFIGEIPHRLVPSLLRQSVLEVHSLDSRTGFDSASVEAMALGVPVVSCVREDNFVRPWLQNRKNVLLVPPRDVNKTAEAIRDILTDAALAKRISEGARKTASDSFSIDRMLRDLEGLYESVASTRS